jgi:hypothetical protein
MAAGKFQIQFQDNSGGKSNLSIETTNTTVDDAVLTDLDNLSYAGIQTVGVLTSRAWTADTPETNPVGGGIASKASLVFRLPSGDLRRLSIPAPKCNVTGGINVVSVKGRDIVPSDDRVDGSDTYRGGTWLAQKFVALAGEVGAVYVSGTIVKYER